VAGERGAQDQRRDGGARGFAEPHAEVEERLEAKLIEQRAVAGFGRNMARHGMRERVGAQPGQGRERGGRDEPVDQHRNARPPRGERRAEERGEFPPAQGGRDPQRIVEQAAVTVECRVDRGTLAREAPIVDAGAAAGPADAAAAEQRRRDGGRRRRVADAHFAEADEVGLGRDRVMAGRHRGQEFVLGHRRRRGEVRGRPFERERDDPQPGVRDAAELIDGGAAGGEIRHHLGGDGGWKGRHALRHHAVIAGEHNNLDAVEPRRISRLPLGEPDHDVLEPAEALRRLGERGIAAGRRGGGGGISVGQIEAGRPQVGKGCEAGHGGDRNSSCGGAGMTGAMKKGSDAGAELREACRDPAEKNQL
jgi:hypothetical protein